LLYSDAVRWLIFVITASMSHSLVWVFFKNAEQYIRSVLISRSLFVRWPWRA
jgi:hypothetical protein